MSVDPERPHAGRPALAAALTVLTAVRLALLRWLPLPAPGLRHRTGAGADRQNDCLLASWWSTGKASCCGPSRTPEGFWRLPVTVADVDPRFFKLLFAYEDKRFCDHHGVDPLAMVRAAWQLLCNGRIVSGASTLTMQVARLLEPRPGAPSCQVRQMVRAVELEQRLSKDADP